jgi:hypothetical protein
VWTDGEAFRQKQLQALGQGAVGPELLPDYSNSGGDGTIRLLDVATKNTVHRLSADDSRGIHAFIFSGVRGPSRSFSCTFRSTIVSKTRPNSG